jgi:uncharacterized protein YggT (Ycf19 family)
MNSHLKRLAIKAGQVLLWLVYIWVSVTLVLLFLTFILELFGANPTAGFVEWVYRSTERAMAPFRGIFEPITLSDQSLLDISVLFAMIVYGFVALGLNVAIDWITRLLRAEEQREHERDALDAQSIANAPGHVVQLADPAGLTATAVLKPQANGTSIELTAAGLISFQSYSAWLEGRDGVRVSTATFQPTTDGTVSLSLTTPVSLIASQRFGLTLLPRPGETTSTDVLSAPLA